MNDERGVASLVAILILLMLAYLIRGTSFTAGTYVDMIRNFKVENELQLAAESKLEEEINRYTSRTFSDSEIDQDNEKFDADRRGVRLKAFDGKVGTVKKHILLIVSVEKKTNHFGNNINAYRSVCAFLTAEPVANADENTPYQYEFGGFLSRTI